MNPPPPPPVGPRFTIEIHRRPSPLDRGIFGFHAHVFYVKVFLVRLQTIQGGIRRDKNKQKCSSNYCMGIQWFDNITEMTDLVITA